MTDNSKLAFIIEGEDSVRIRMAMFHDVESLTGATGTLDRPLSWHEMREVALDDYITRKFGSHEESDRWFGRAESAERVRDKE